MTPNLCEGERMVCLSRFEPEPEKATEDARNYPAGSREINSMKPLRTYRLPLLLGGLLILIGAAALTLTLSPTTLSKASTSLYPPILSAWIVNTTGEINPHWPSSPVNVQSVTQTSIGGVPYVQVQTHSIANYHTSMTMALIEELNSRPRAATDFRNGQTTATVGQDVLFGDDIGYRYQPCTLGYWPPGPSCPNPQNRTANFPMQPLLATQAVSTSLGAIGLWVNGVAIYNWSDAQSYQNGHVWYNTAPSFEQYDLDICPGHAANGDYHHHSYPDCLANMLGDTGTAHSPVYGFAADGFPVYGPWEAAGVLAQSGWKTRDYDDPASPTGCGVAHIRNCLLRNPLDPSQGTIPASQTGPRTDANVTTMSGNVISATSGIFFQDYYYDNTCTTCLDPHNGIDDGDGLGYHYQLTVREPVSGTRLVPVFPYTIGPTYAGRLNPVATYTPTGTPTYTRTPTQSSAPTSTSTPPTQPVPSPTRTSTQATAPTSTRTSAPTSTPLPEASATQALPTATSTSIFQPTSTSVTNSDTSTPTFTPTVTAAATATTILATPPTSTVEATITPTPCTVNFLDVHPGDYFYEGVRYLYCAGVISGYPDGTFRPYSNASRGQVTKIIVLAFDYTLHIPQHPTFSDVPPANTFYSFVETAAYNGIVSGYPDGTFLPNNPVTRGQLAKITSNAAHYSENHATATFSDVPVGATFHPFVERLASRDIINGYQCGGPGEPCPGIYFRPNNDVTRGQIAKIVFIANSTNSPLGPP